MPSSHEFVPQLRFKLVATVWRKAERHTKFGNPYADEGTSNGVHGDVGKTSCFRSAGDAIYAGEEVPVAV